MIHKTSGIPVDALRGNSLTIFDVEQRMAWLAGRQTCRPEDRAYCLLGVFNIHIPVLYGEGEKNSLRRLQEALSYSTAKGMT